MEINVLTIIILITVITSYQGFNKPDLLDRWMFMPYRCKNNNENYRIFSHILIHADWTHLIFNMFSLYFLGQVLLGHPQCQYFVNGNCGLTEEFGEVTAQVHFLILYVLGGLFATLIPYIRQYDNPNYRALGASGAVSAVVFGSIMWAPNMELQLLFIPIPIKAYIFGPLYLLYEFYASKKGNTGIAHDAHIGGALFGIAYILIINFDKGRELITMILGNS